jgi:hypothetical protein
MDAHASVFYRVPRRRQGWELSEETMPESTFHDDTVDLLRALLTYWASTHGGPVRVARNLAVRWDESDPRIGVDPDVCVLRPAPPDAANLRSLRTWEPGHLPPPLAVEVVSETNPRKDYVVAPDKYAASGCGELWIVDPLLAGPASHGGPFLLQVWTRGPSGVFDRIYAGDGPCLSPFLQAWVHVGRPEGTIRLSGGADGSDLWWTAVEAERRGKEAERIAKEAERRGKEAERSAKEAALARVAELEAKLAQLEAGASEAGAAPPGRPTK